MIAELLFEEKLVLARTTPARQTLRPEDHVEINWGRFSGGLSRRFPDQPSAVVSIDYGPLALDYILAAGGSGYFRQGFIRPYLEEGRLMLVPDSPEFSYSAYVVHSTTADLDLMARIRSGLRAAAVSA